MPQPTNEHAVTSVRANQVGVFVISSIVSVAPHDEAICVAFGDLSRTRVWDATVYDDVIFHV